MPAYRCVPGTKEILLVDDDEVVRALVAEMLAQQGQCPSAGGPRR